MKPLDEKFVLMLLATTCWFFFFLSRLTNSIQIHTPLQSFLTWRPSTGRLPLKTFCWIYQTTRRPGARGVDGFEVFASATTEDNFEVFSRTAVSRLVHIMCHIEPLESSQVHHLQMFVVSCQKRWSSRSFQQWRQQQ